MSALAEYHDTVLVVGGENYQMSRSCQTIRLQRHHRAQ
jgi:hypothetical protein